MKKRIFALFLAGCLIVQGIQAYAGPAETEGATEGAAVESTEETTEETSAVEEGSGGDVEDTETAGVETEESTQEAVTPAQEGDTTETAGTEAMTETAAETETVPEGMTGTETAPESATGTETAPEGMTETETTEETVTGTEPEMLTMTEEVMPVASGNGVVTGCRVSSAADLGLAFGDNVRVSGNTVELLQDVVVEGQGFSLNTGSYIFDLNGYTLKGDVGFIFENYGTGLFNYENPTFTVKGSGKIYNTSNGHGIYFYNGGSLTIQGDVTVECTGGIGVQVFGASLRIDGGTFKGGLSGVFTGGSSGTKVINGGTFSGREGLSDNSGEAPVKINGGTFMGDEFAYNSILYKLGVALGDGKMAYKYEGGSAGNKLSAAELNKAEVVDSFIVTEERDESVEFNGKVTLPGGIPDNAQVSWSSGDSSYAGNIMDGGKYTLTNVPDGVYTVWYHSGGKKVSAGSVEVKNSVIAGGTPDITVGAGSLSGIVRDGEGNPLSGAGVTIQSNGITYTTGQKTGDGGEYEIPFIPEGTYTVWVQVGEDNQNVLTTSIVGSTSGDLVYGTGVVPGKASVGAFVHDAGGNRIPGASVSLMNQAGDTIQEVTTGDGGDFRFEAVADGEYTMMAQKGLLTGSSSLSIKNGAVETAQESCNILIGHTVKGTVSLPDGSAGTGTEVIFKDADNKEWRAAAGDGGNYEIACLPEGVYQVYMDNGSGEMQGGSVRITQSGAGGRVDLIYGITSRGVTGKIVDREGNGIAGAQVTLKGTGGKTYQIVTGADGGYWFNSVADGEYIMKVTASGKKTAAQPLSVTGDRRDIRTVMEAEGGSGGSSGSGGDGGNSGSGGDGGNSGSGGDGGNSGSGGDGGSNGNGGSGGDGGNNGSGGNSGNGGYGGNGGSDGSGGDGGNSGSGGNGGSGGNSANGGSHGSGGDIGNGGSSGSSAIAGPGGGNAPGSGELNTSGENSFIVAINNNGALPDGTDPEGLPPTGIDGRGAAAGGMDGQGTAAVSTKRNNGGSQGASAMVGSGLVSVDNSEANAISGKLTGRDAGSALITVTNRMDPKDRRSAKTDESGAYRIDGLADGSYVLEIHTVGSRTLKAEFEVSGGRSNLEADSFQVSYQGGEEPKTGDSSVPVMPVAMLGSAAYLLDLFCEKKGIRLGMREAQKVWLVDAIVRKAKGKGRLPRWLAVGAVFAVLVFYYSIGKIVEFDAGELDYA